MVLLRLYLGVLAGILSGFALLLVTGRYMNDGPTLVVLGPSRGVHLGDLLVLAGWAVGMLALIGIALERRRREPADGSGDRAAG